MGITSKQKADIDKLTEGNSAAKARIQARVNKLLQSKGKKPVMQMAPGGDVQYRSQYDKLLAKQQGSTQPVMPGTPGTENYQDSLGPARTDNQNFQLPGPGKPRPRAKESVQLPVETPVETTTAAPTLTTPDNLTTTYSIDDPRNPNYVAPDQPINIPSDDLIVRPNIPEEQPYNYFKTLNPDGTYNYKRVQGMGRTANDLDSTKEEYEASLKDKETESLPDPKDSVVKEEDIPDTPNGKFAKEILEMSTGLREPNLKYDFNGSGKVTSQDALDMAKYDITSPAPVMPDDVVEPVKDEAIFDAEAYMDANPDVRKSFENGGRTPYDSYVTYGSKEGKEFPIDKVKLKELYPEYSNAKENFDKQTKIYEAYTDFSLRPQEFDSSVTVDYQTELDNLQNDLAKQSSVITTMPTGVAPPAEGEEDTRTYEEKAQFEANQSALKKFAETQTQTNVAKKNLKNAGTKSGVELLAGIQEDPMASVTKQDVSKLADKVDPNQFIDEDTGQVKTKTQAGVTTVSGTAVADDPTAVDEATYDADTVTTEAKKELKSLAGAESEGPSKTIVGQQGKLGTQSVADEAMKVNEDRINKVKTKTNIVVDNDQLAKFKGEDYAKVVADIAVSDALVKAKAQTGSVKLEELPPPAEISEDQMASAQAMQDIGLVADAIPVAARMAAFSVKDGTLALAMEGNVDALSTVEGQLSKLMKSFNDGTPSWASGAIRAANAALASRGLGASSMASVAILNAAMESALPIAQQDANTFATMGLTNLNNQQQVALSNAAAQQGLSLAMLSNEQQANLQKSSNAFALQTQNLSNRQSVELANAQIRATLQGKILDNTQQSNIIIAARYAESANINLSNKQQAAMQDSVGSLQTNLANLTAKSQSYITSANLAANLQGQVLSNDQQVAITNAARYSEVSNITFSADQQRVLHNSSLMQSIGLAELSSEQASVLQNAANFAGLDMTNLSNLQQAQVENAKNFLNIDLANLTNDQQAIIFKAQATQQALLSDQAAENAALNFNASSENQINQFNETMKAQVSQFNATQTNAIAQFNAGEMNATEKFNTQLEADRKKFNAQNALIVEQANTKWRQDIATIDTAAENSANAAAAAAANELTQAAIGEVWQQERDLLDHAFTAAESEKDRTNNIIVEKMRADSTTDAAKMKAEMDADATIGAAVLQFAFG